MKFILFFCSFSLCIWSCFAHKPQKIKPIEKIALSIPEPSDIVFDSAHNGFYIVSDNGFLFKTDVSGNVLQQADYDGQDNEAVYADEEFVYAVEERSHKIVVFQKSDLSPVATYLIPYFGGRNKGYEAFTFNPEKIDGLSSRQKTRFIYLN